MTTDVPTLLVHAAVAALGFGGLYAAARARMVRKGVRDATSALD